MVEHKTKETKTAGLLKAFLYGVVTVILYYVIFTHTQLLLDLAEKKTYWSALTFMAITLLVASIYGTAVSKLLKHTLEKALESQRLREE